MKKKVVIIGGGLAGLTASILLARSGIECLVIEKKNYPHHRVCGEYISNEAKPFLKSIGLFPSEKDLPQISRFMLTSVNGKNETLPLDLGGFGVSRYYFDHFLFENAKSSGVQFVLDSIAESVEFSGHSFATKVNEIIFESDVVIGAFGKRSNLDVKLDRSFIKKRSPYVGIKYHVELQYPSDLIALHNFPGGYCGVSRIEDEKVNLCYLVHRDKLRDTKTIEALEHNVLSVNPFLKDIFGHAKFLFEKPETINEISFEPKTPVEDHILMAGDSAGMITPLCGNGMAIAIHSAKIVSELVRDFVHGKISRSEMEYRYSAQWNNNFRGRLFVGRQVQRLFGSEVASNVAINLALYVRPVARAIIRNTHGRTF